MEKDKEIRDSCINAIFFVQLLHLSYAFLFHSSSF